MHYKYCIAVQWYTILLWGIMEVTLVSIRVCSHLVYFTQVLHPIVLKRNLRDSSLRELRHGFFSAADFKSIIQKKVPCCFFYTESHQISHWVALTLSSHIKIRQRCVQNCGEEIHCCKMKITLDFCHGFQNGFFPWKTLLCEHTLSTYFNIFISTINILYCIIPSFYHHAINL